MTVPKATRIIVEKHNIKDRELESRIYRSILSLANKGEYRGRRYKHENSRMWEIGEEVISFIEDQFNLTKEFINDEEIQIPMKNDVETLNIIRTLVNSCLKNRISKEQFFDIIADLLIDNNDNK